MSLVRRKLIRVAFRSFCVFYDVTKFVFAFWPIRSPYFFFLRPDWSVPECRVCVLIRDRGVGTFRIFKGRRVYPAHLAIIVSLSRRNFRAFKENRPDRRLLVVVVLRVVVVLFSRKSTLQTHRLDRRSPCCCSSFVVVVILPASRDFVFLLGTSRPFSGTSSFSGAYFHSALIVLFRHFVFLRRFFSLACTRFQSLSQVFLRPLSIFVFRILSSKSFASFSSLKFTRRIARLFGSFCPGRRLGVRAAGVFVDRVRRERSFDVDRVR